MLEAPRSESRTIEITKAAVTTIRYTWRHAEADIAPIAAMVGLDDLDLSDNPFTDITPLANNTGLGLGDFFDITNIGSVFCNNATINFLQGKGVSVGYNNNNC
jgi:hypothetical protein